MIGDVHHTFAFVTESDTAVVKSRIGMQQKDVLVKRQVSSIERRKRFL